MLKLFLLCNFFVGLAVAGPVGDFEANDPRVVNGTDADISEFPFLISLRLQNKHSCAGTLLNPMWVLTAASCVDDYSLKDMSIQFNSTKISPGSPNVVKIYKTFPHEQYDSSTLENDIALIKLNYPVGIEEEYFVNLPSLGQSFETGTSAVLAGWGRNATGGEMQETLQKVTLQVYSAEDCQEQHSEGSIYSTNICGEVSGGGKGQCNGDSGGPLIIDGVQVGIVSWSLRPCGAPFPGVFTGVAHFVDWIYQTIEAN